MSIIGLLLVVAIFAFCGWLILQIPMPDLARKVIIGIMIFVLVIYCLQAVGVVTGLPQIRLLR